MNRWLRFLVCAATGLLIEGCASEIPFSSGQCLATPADGWKAMREPPSNERQLLDLEVDKASADTTLGRIGGSWRETWFQKGGAVLMVCRFDGDAHSCNGSAKRLEYTLDGSGHWIPGEVLTVVCTGDPVRK